MRLNGTLYPLFEKITSSTNETSALNAMMETEIQKLNEEVQTLEADSITLEAIIVQKGPALEDAYVSASTTNVILTSANIFHESTLPLMNRNISLLTTIGEEVELEKREKRQKTTDIMLENTKLDSIEKEQKDTYLALCSDNVFHLRSLTGACSEAILNQQKMDPLIRKYFDANASNGNSYEQFESSTNPKALQKLFADLGSFTEVKDRSKNVDDAVVGGNKPSDDILKTLRDYIASSDPLSPFLQSCMYHTNNEVFRVTQNKLMIERENTELQRACDVLVNEIRKDCTSSTRSKKIEVNDVIQHFHDLIEKIENEIKSIIALLPDTNGAAKKVKDLVEEIDVVIQHQIAGQRSRITSLHSDIQVAEKKVAGTVEFREKYVPMILVCILDCDLNN